MSKTRDHAAMEKRRKKAGKLFAKECSAPDVARRLGVARQVAYRWKNAWDQGGSAALVSKGAAGPKAKLTMEQTQQVTEALLAGPAAHGYKTALWTCLLYTSDAADDLLCVDLGGRRIIKKKKNDTVSTHRITKKTNPTHYKHTNN